MRAVKFIRKSPLFTESEKCQLINAVQPQIRWLIENDIKKELNNPFWRSGESDSSSSQSALPGTETELTKDISWRYGLFVPKKTGSKTLLFWQSEIQNFLYDVDLESLDPDKDGSLFGLRYKKKKSAASDPDLPSNDPYDQAMRLLPYLAGRFHPVPVEELPSMLALGRGVMAHFRPPRDRHFSLEVFAAAPPPSRTDPPVTTITTSTTTTTSTSATTSSTLPETLPTPGPLPPDTHRRAEKKNLQLPPFESRDYHFYSTARNRIESRFLSFEAYLLRKVQGWVHAVKQAKEDVLCSQYVETARSVKHAAASLPGHVSAALGHTAEHPPPPLHDKDLSNMNDLSHFWTGASCGSVKRQAREGDEEGEGQGGQGGLVLRPPPLILLPTAPPAHHRRNQEVLIAVRYRFLDQSFVSLRHLHNLHLHHLPLVIPNPNPAAATSKTFSTLRLARAEFVIFASLITLGAAPAAYRGLNFSFEHPMFAQAVAASILGTIAYTAWSSRLKMEMEAKLLIEEATLSRVVSQDSQTASFLLRECVEVCTDAALLLYSVKLTKQRLRSAGQRGPSSSENSSSNSLHQDAINVDFAQQCEELQLAKRGSRLMTHALRERVQGLLQEWHLVSGGGGGGSSSSSRAQDDGSESGDDEAEVVCELEQVLQVLTCPTCSSSQSHSHTPAG